MEQNLWNEPKKKYRKKKGSSGIRREAWGAKGICDVVDDEDTPTLGRQRAVLGDKHGLDTFAAMVGRVRLYGQ
jgi:hypothetical protein